MTAPVISARTFTPAAIGLLFGGAALLLACTRSRPSGEAATQASSSASADAGPPVLGSVDHCARPGDRCASGFCRAGRCEPSPKPFATRVRGNWVSTFAGDGFVVEDASCGLSRPDCARFVRYRASGKNEPLMNRELRMRPFAWFNWDFYGFAVNSGDLVETADPRTAGKVLGSLPGARQLIHERTLAADESGLYIMAIGVKVLRDGKVLDMLRQLSSTPGQGGWAVDAAVGPREVYWPTMPVKSDVPSYLYAIRKDGSHPRLLTTGERLGAVGTDPNWLYFGGEGAVSCLPHAGGRPRRFLTFEGQTEALGVEGGFLYFAVLSEHDRVLSRVPLPVCVP